MTFIRKSPPAQPRRRRPAGRAPVNTYYRSKEGAEQASPFKKRPPKKNRRKYLLGFIDAAAIVLLLVSLVNSLLLSPTPKVSISDLSYHPANIYAEQTKASFAGIKNRNKITFDESGVVKQIQSRLPEVQTVHIELPFFSRDARVRLIVSPPAFTLTSNNQPYIIDSSGLAVAKTESLPKIHNLMNVSDQSGYSAEVGKQVLSSQSVAFISTLIKQCQRAKVPLSAISLPALPQEVELRTTDQPYFVKFYLGGDVNVETGQFLAARQKFAQSNITPSEYLDVRVSGKIFYK